MKQQGFALAEVLIGSAIASIVIGGVMAAHVTAARILGARNGPELAEASGYAQQFLEQLHNRVAADDTFFPTAAAAGPVWQNDPSLPAGGGSESIVNQPAKRCYRVTASANPGGTLYAVEVKVCWKELSGCPCA